MYLVWLFCFWAMQAAAQVIFGYGSTAPQRFVPCFILGNVFGASSIWLLMLLYRSMNPNLALGLRRCSTWPRFWSRWGWVCSWRLRGRHRPTLNRRPPPAA